MKITASYQDNYTVLKLEGRLDLNSSSDLKEHVRRSLSKGGTNLILDLNDVGFINSSGLGSLVSILKDVRTVKGRMVLCNLARYVQEVFEITQLSQLFDIHSTEKQAAASFTESAMNVNQ